MWPLAIKKLDTHTVFLSCSILNENADVILSGLPVIVQNVCHLVYQPILLRQMTCRNLSCTTIMLSGYIVSRGQRSPQEMDIYCPERLLL